MKTEEKTNISKSSGPSSYRMFDNSQSNRDVTYFDMVDCEENILYACVSYGNNT